MEEDFFRVRGAQSLLDVLNRASGLDDVQESIASQLLSLTKKFLNGCSSALQTTSIILLRAEMRPEHEDSGHGEHQTLQWIIERRIACPDA